MLMTNKPTNKTTAITVEWPTTHFTIQDVYDKYKDADGNPLIVEITLRFRVNRALENRDIVAIGKLKPAIGRPKLVFVRANSSKEVLAAAKLAGVILNDDKATVPVAEVNTASKAKTTATTSTSAATSKSVSVSN